MTLKHLYKALDIAGKVLGERLWEVGKMADGIEVDTRAMWLRSNV